MKRHKQRLSHGCPLPWASKENTEPTGQLVGGCVLVRAYAIVGVKELRVGTVRLPKAPQSSAMPAFQQGRHGPLMEGADPTCGLP